LYFAAGFEIKIPAKSCDKQNKTPVFRFGTLKKQRRERNIPENVGKGRFVSIDAFETEEVFFAGFSRHGYLVFRLITT